MRGERIARRMAAMQQQPHGDERRQRVAHHVQAQHFIQRVRKRGQLERQAGDGLPRHQPGQGAVEQDGHREGAILAIGRGDRRHARAGRVAGASGKIGMRAFQRRACPRAASPASARRSTSSVVARLLGLSTVSPQPPSAHCVSRQPAYAGADHAGIGRRAGQRQGAHRGRGGERGGGQAAFPIAIRPISGEQTVARGTQGGAESRGCRRRAHGRALQACQAK